ncbi:MAG: ribonuclease HI family protein [Patescibacteria group bacterium]
MKQYIIHTDGGSRGNPGHAAVGVVIDEKFADGKLHRVKSHGEYIGIATNNVAEYTAVSVALSELIKQEASCNGDDAVYEFYLDSLLVVQQLNGVYKVKDATLRECVFTIRVLEQRLGGKIHYMAVRRALNTDADREVNRALDMRTSS